MSESAYSIELKEKITARKAVELSAKNKLTDNRSFKCCDEKCGISLTCTNWKNTKGKRFYFVPSSNDELHVIGCDEVSAAEKRNQIAKELTNISSEVKNNGIITMITSPDRNTKEAKEKPDTSSLAPNGKKYKNNNNLNGIHSESKRASNIETFVELFKINDIDKDKSLISVNNKKYSLNTLFIPSDKKINANTFGIFYGSSKINTIPPENTMVEISFCDSSLPPVYTSLKTLHKISNSKKIKHMINKDILFVTYFRGTYNYDNRKFTKYNDKFYKDLYFETLDDDY